MRELSGPGYMRDEELREYATTLKGKTARYKSLKLRLQQIQAETVVLARTESVGRRRYFEPLPGLYAVFPLSSCPQLHP